MKKIIDIDSADRRRFNDKLREILEYHCGFRGTNTDLVEIEEEISKLYEGLLLPKDIGK